MTEVVAGYDAVLFDLDGVVYLGPEPVPGAAEGIARLRDRNVPVGFVTNNAARAPQAVVDHLNALGIPCTDQEVVTAGQAGVLMLTQELPAGASVLVCGSPALVEQVRDAGFAVALSADDHPDAVIQGYFPELGWPTLTEAALAVQRGARWFATNLDPSRPTDRGLEPGAGAQIAAVRLVVGGEPRAAGKPDKPLMLAATARLGAERPIFVGDRLDTDIAGGINSGLDTMLVFTGSHRAPELFDAVPSQRPDHVGRDLRDLLAPVRTVSLSDGRARCGDASVHLEDGRVRIDAPGDAMDLVWATARLVWDVRDAGGVADPGQVLEAVAGELAR
ncbi:Haloacid Dehalogenase Superfamily Class (subfamily) IIA [Raineyella antarctica]|uniref:Haloacid Dehalogenase Superfamily Class (Subfamily) IIA n=1 Tax=Raineyella antarctica TaxID=1577474 RepID=A0A1G6GSW7_9ACTN|nr:HAD-IIA family hydrolase [Raineyella antarctica]SDB84775.1 Haloacid Dehalogenase Superfamily Class (subfamily) IIA [Raineyella antarctica]